MTNSLLPDNQDGEPRTKEHPEARCDRCGRENVWSWHAPSPLWNAVEERLEKAGGYAYSVLCPPCFAQLAEAIIGGVVWCFKPHGVDVSALWTDGDGRTWDAENCLWISPAASSPSSLGSPPQEEGSPNWNPPAIKALRQRGYQRINDPRSVSGSPPELKLSEEEIEHIHRNWRPVAVCQTCRDIIEKLDAHAARRISQSRVPEEKKWQQHT